MTPAEQFREVIHKHLGVAPAVVIGDGKTHRFSINGKKRDDAGEYRFYDDRFPAGFAKDYRQNIFFTWSARDDATVLSESDRAEYARIKRNREERRQREQAEAARLAQQRWQKAEAADPAHEYLTRKSVKPHGIRQDGETLLIPVMDGEEVISVQSIGPDGRKLFQLGSRVKGGFFTIGDASDTIYICEGYATAATIYELTGQQTVVAFNAGNLLAVAPKIRANNPEAYVVICGDDDFAVDKNPGVRDATKAAKIINGYLAIPPFDRDAGEDGTDFNDLATLHGSRAVQDVLDAALDAGPLKGEAEQQAKKEQDYYSPPGEPAPAGAKSNKFKFESVADIVANFDPASEEWLVKKLFPRVGVAVLYGQSMSFKSFIAIDIGGHISHGWNWSDRKTAQGAVIYIAAEGAAGVRKRIIGFHQYNKDRGASDAAPFHMTAVAPNLGTAQGDLKELISAVEAICPDPSLIELDTIAASLGGADENGAGMAQLLINATALSNHFKCLVLAIHHVGLSNDQRMRGWSGLTCGIDVELICERQKDSFDTTMSLKKLKDEETKLNLNISMDRIVIALDSDGDDISTLVVNTIEEVTEKPKAATPAKLVPRAQRLLMTVIVEALEEAGEPFRPFADGPSVRAVPDAAVRERYYAKIAEAPKPDDTPKKLADRQRQAFCASIKKAIDAKMVVAALRNGERVLWLP
jgi:putative DNA primase/helicase